MTSVRVALIWAALAAVICVPIALAMRSDLLQWRGTIYILAGFAGIFALGLLLVQPLLIAGYLPFPAYRARRARGVYECLLRLGPADSPTSELVARRRSLRALSDWGG